MTDNTPATLPATSSVGDALDRLDKSDPDIAAVLRYLVDSVDEARTVADQLGAAFSNPSMLTRMLGGSMFGG